MRQLFADGVTLSSNSTCFKAIASTAILWPFRSAPTNASLISSNVLTISRSRLISSSAPMFLLSKAYYVDSYHRWWSLSPRSFPQRTRQASICLLPPTDGQGNNYEISNQQSVINLQSLKPVRISAHEHHTPLLWDNIRKNICQQKAPYSSIKQANSSLRYIRKTPFRAVSWQSEDTKSSWMQTLLSSIRSKLQL